MIYSYVVIGQHVTVSINCTKCDRVISFGANHKDFIEFMQGKDPEVSLPYVPHYSRIMLIDPTCESCRSRSKTHS